MLKQDYDNDFFELGQQKINFSFFELHFPDDDPVYTLKNVMEELDFTGLLACYSDKGRTGYNPIMMYAVVTYANMRGVRAVDRIVELCERNLAFIWLTKGQKPKRDVVAVLLINLTAALINNTIDKITDQKESQMWNFFGKVFSDKQMSMDYADLENADIQHQRKKAEENLFMFGNGLGQLVWGTAGLVTATVNIIVSISMTITLFTQRSEKIWLESPLWIFIVLIAILLVGLCNQKMTVYENEVFRKWCEGTVWFNRSFMFFGRELYMNPDRAKDVRIYEQQRIADREHEKMMEHNGKDNKMIVKMSFLPSLSAFAIGTGNAVCYLYVVLKAYFGAFGVGNIIQYVGVLSRLGEGVQELMYILGDNEAYCTHLQELFDYLDIPNGKYQGTLPVEKRAFCNGGDYDYEIEFQNVSFCYPGSEQYALCNVSMKFKIGQKLAVVGMNGSGKTTFIKLLCRLYDPTEGEILLNGIDIKKYDYDEYMIVLDEPTAALDPIAEAEI